MRAYDILSNMVTKMAELTTSVNNAKLDAWPIGSFYFNDGINPADKLGGTWIPVEGSFLYAVSELESLGNAMQTEGPIIPDGGQDTVILQPEHIPAHDHGSAGAHQHPSAGNHAHYIGYRYDGDWCKAGTRSAVNGHTSGTINTSGAGEHTHGSAGAHTHTYFGGNNPGHNGDTIAHNNMPPYIKVHCWKRVE